MLCAEGNLEDDLGNSEAAAAILRRAATLFEGTAETFLWAKTLARLAYTLVDLDPAESLRIVEQAAELIPLGNPRLVWSTEVIRINGLIVYLLGFHLRRGQKAEALAVCRRARTELAQLDDEEGSSAIAREQMVAVWLDLEDEVRRGTVDLGAPAVLRNYIKAHWRTQSPEPPRFRG